MKVGSLVEVEYMADRDISIGVVVAHGYGWHWVAFPHKDMKQYYIQESRLKLLTDEKT